jgi:hypothetical protein
LAQLALTNAALTAANEAMNNARFEMETDAELSSKTTVVEASKQAIPSQSRLIKHALFFTRCKRCF